MRVSRGNIFLSPLVTYGIALNVDIMSTRKSGDLKSADF